MKQKFSKKIVMIGAGIAGINAATKLIDEGYPGELITIIDKGEDPYNRPKDELMHGFAGAGGFSDGKLTYHTSIGGHMSKYCGEDKAMELMDQVIKNFQRFHPNPSEMFLSNPTEEPDFIKPYFSLRLFPVWHIGTDYLQKINEAWYEFLLDNGVTFLWQADVQDIDFDKNEITYTQYSEDWEVLESDIVLEYDKLLFGAGKSGIELSQQLIDKYELPTEPKSAQVGVRFEAPQKYFEDIIEVSYDFKLYQRPNEQVSLRSFCLPGNELIFTRRENVNQFLPIEEVNLEDEILTYNFDKNQTEFQKPSKLYKREYKGDLITINNKLTTTEDHTYFVLEKELVEEAYDRTDGGKDDAFKLNKIIEVPANKLKIGDRLVTPSSFPKLNSRRYTSYSNDYLYLFGLWFADGSGQYGSKSDIKNFTLTNEDYILNEIIKILEKEGERYTSKKEFDNYSVLNFYSPILKEFLVNEGCFVKGKERGLPKSIFNWSEEEIIYFLSGLFDGDGRVKKEYNICFDYFTSSDLLYRDLTYLLNFLGIEYKSRTRISDTNFKKNAKVNIINVAQRESMLVLSQKLKLKNLNKNKLLKENLQIEFNKRDCKNYEKVYSIESQEFEGDVYDFEVKEYHNFLAGKTPLVIHNCTNNYASYVAVEETYGDITYNGHAKKGEEFRNDMTNFGILMEVKDVKNPFEWTRKLVQSCQNYKGVKVDDELSKEVNLGGIYYSPNNTRQPSLTDEGKKVKTVQLNNLDIFKETFGEYAQYVITFIENMNEIFKFGNDWGIYIPEVKYLNEEVLVNYDNLSLVDYENVYFVGDTLSARGITVSAAQAIYAVESILNRM